MRVIAGTAKGVRLAPVPGGTRPLSDRAREGLFSSLGETIQGARVLDLYAGTGATGIEALSRGASEAVFVESSPEATATIRENLKRTNLTRSARVLRRDAARALSGHIGRFGLILIDPPYDEPVPRVERLLGEIAGRGLARPDCRVVLTRRSESYTPVIPVNWQPDRQLSYGDSVVLVFKT